MATKYILDPSGNIKTFSDQVPTEENNSINLNPEPGEVEQEGINELSVLLANSSIHQNVDVDVGDDFASDDFTSNANVTNSIPNDSSFGFVGNQTGARESFKPMYHFSDPDSRYFAKEFEILTGYTGIAVGDTDEIPQTDIIFFIMEYFTEIIVMLGVVEGFTNLNELLSSNITNNTSTVEKFDLRMGKYSIQEYDIFTKYIFTILNYPKDHSNFFTRITSLFVGFASWLTPDEPFYLETIIEEAGRSGSKKLENVYDLLAFKNQNVGFGVFTSLANIGIAMLEIIVNTAISDSSYKRLNLLIKKFRQEKAWKNQLYNYKNREEVKFFAELDYYYFRFAVERMHVGLKLLNRYAHKKTYLDPMHKESPLSRVSGHRTSQKAKREIIGLKIELEEKQKKGLDFETAYLSVLSALDDYSKSPYKWTAENSDSQSYKPGMTTRLRALPQLLNLSNSFLKSLIINKDSEKIALKLDKSIEQNFYKHKDNSRKIPKELVKELEDHLESEYVPFYMHDLRTNEVLSFHAFIESVSDSFTPEYVSTTGFGRIDDVRSYVKTTRNINLTFTVAATSETDHDFMWYQINKLVTMVYPQWSEGFLTKDKEGKPFFFPFTQVPTASPLIRIRLGDVLKNNYSRSSLSRLFGAELDKVKSENVVKNTPSDFNSVVNDPKSFEYEILPGLYKVEPESDSGISLDIESPSDFAYYEVKNPLRVNTPLTIFGEEIDLNLPYVKVPLTNVKNKNGNMLILNVDSSKIVKKQITIENINMGDLDKRKQHNNELMMPFKNNGVDQLISNNPITNAYETGMSRGIAGFITQLDVNYNDSNWETSRIGSKAPMLVKITLNFAPIHDIPPGIDHNGMMRAPIYNVGRVNNQMFGDPHDKDKIGSGIKNAITKYDEIKKSSEDS